MSQPKLTAEQILRTVKNGMWKFDVEPHAVCILSEHISKLETKIAELKEMLDLNIDGRDLIAEIDGMKEKHDKWRGVRDRTAEQLREMEKDINLHAALLRAIWKEEE